MINNPFLTTPFTEIIAYHSLVFVLQQSKWNFRVTIKEPFDPNLPVVTLSILFQMLCEFPSYSCEKMMQHFFQNNWPCLLGFWIHIFISRCHSFLSFFSHPGKQCNPFYMLPTYYYCVWHGQQMRILVKSFSFE